MTRLAELLRPVVSSRPRVQLYLCFLGDEDEPPQGRRGVSLRELQDAEFCFRNLEVVTVFKGLTQDAANPHRGAVWRLYTSSNQAISPASMISAVVLGVVAWLAAMLLIDFAVMAYLYKPRKGKFRVGRDDDHAFTATTDFGRLAIDRRKGRLVIGETEIDLAAIERLDYAWNAEWAFVEELFVGFDPWDVFDTYQDRVNWYQVSVIVAGSKRVPLFIIGQYEPKEPFTQWWFDWQVQVLERWGLYQDAEDQARRTLERLQAAFLRSGRELRLAAAPTKHPGQKS